MSAGMIGVVSGTLTRYPEFMQALLAVASPPGSQVTWVSGCSIAENRNKVVRRALAAGAEWLWFMDDDHTFSPNALLHLLAHGRDIVTPLVLMRTHPHHPVIYDAPQAGATELPHHFLRDRETGLIEVHAAGTGGMLIRRRVLEALEDPWFEVGRIRPDGMGEDLWFCEKARGKGFRLYCDLDTPLGHTTPMTVVPIRHQGKWMTGVKQGGTTHLVDKAWPPLWQEGVEGGEGSLTPPVGGGGEKVPPGKAAGGKDG